MDKIKLVLVIAVFALTSSLGVSAKKLTQRRAQRFVGSWSYEDAGGTITIIVKSVRKTSKNRFAFVYDVAVGNVLSDLNLLGVLTTDKRAVFTISEFDGHSLVGFKLNNAVNRANFSSIFIRDRICSVDVINPDGVIGATCAVGVGQVDKVSDGIATKR